MIFRVVPCIFLLSWEIVSTISYPNRLSDLIFVNFCVFVDFWCFGGSGRVLLGFLVPWIRCFIILALFAKIVFWRQLRGKSFWICQRLFGIFVFSKYHMMRGIWCHIRTERDEISLDHRSDPNLVASEISSGPKHSPAALFFWRIPIEFPGIGILFSFPS